MHYFFMDSHIKLNSLNLAEYDIIFKTLIALNYTNVLL